MTSEKQIAANRRNATRSTGPITAEGKARSSRNAFRHGLSRPAIAVEIGEFAIQLVGEEGSPTQRDDLTRLHSAVLAGPNARWACHDHHAYRRRRGCSTARRWAFMTRRAQSRP
jgi:hypothetical protein